jgi:hypothetical protein
MNVRAGLIALGMLLLAAVPALAQIKPAGYAEGVVEAIDPQARLLTVGGATFRVNSSTTTSIYALLPGNVVEVQYVMDNGEWVALDVIRKRQNNGLRFLKWSF